MKRIDRALVYRVRAARRFLPEPVQRALARRRHLAHVRINQGHLTDPAYLGNPPDHVITWISPDGLPTLPPEGLSLEPLDDRACASIRTWLTETVCDSDAMLDRRMDNHGDELGRVRAALRTRLRITQLTSGVPPHDRVARGGRILVDARALQSPAFGHRGIGRFASATLRGVRDAVSDSRIDLLIDPGLEPLPDELTGRCRLVRWIDAQDADEYAVLVQPSPMTATPDPLLHVLATAPISVALVYDFIPAHYPTVYLRYAPMAAEYAACLDALRMYTHVIAISHLAASETTHRVGTGTIRVAWPRAVHDQSRRASATPQSRREGPIVILTGDEPRKDTFGALAVAGAATADAPARDVVVVGMPGQATRVHHWSIAAMMRPGEARTCDRLSDEEMGTLLRQSSLALVTSFDEGLSLPVIEALAAGTPVVASDIPAHRELLGPGAFLAPPGDIPGLTAAVRSHRGSARTVEAQGRHLATHEHLVLEDLVADIVRSALEGTPAADTAPPNRAVPRTSEGSSEPTSDPRPRVAFMTPWVPQRTGVADFSTAVGRELAALCDLTVVTTSDARVEAAIATRPLDTVLEDPETFRSEFDAVILVMGNSHFHLPFEQALTHLHPIVVAHDTRIVEFYMALRSPGGAAAVMMRGQESGVLVPPLDEQIDDMRLLQNAGFWEIAHRARTLVLHSPSAATRIEHETGVVPALLPFANQRVPDSEHVTRNMRDAARARLGLDPAQVHIATFGYIDPRTKLTDVVLEACGWLHDWGQPIHLHIVGAGSSHQVDELRRRASEVGLAGFTVTGFAPEAQFRDYLLGIDCAVQLRVSPLLGVSGPLSDLAAFGTTAVASSGLCLDVDTPEFITPLPTEASPVMIAQAIEHALAHPIPDERREDMRISYLSGKTPAAYARALLELALNIGGSR